MYPTMIPSCSRRFTRLLIVLMLTFSSRAMSRKLFLASVFSLRRIATSSSSRSFTVTADGGGPGGTLAFRGRARGQYESCPCARRRSFLIRTSIGGWVFPRPPNPLSPNGVTIPRLPPLGLPQAHRVLPCLDPL